MLRAFQRFLVDEVQGRPLRGLVATTCLGNGQYSPSTLHGYEISLHSRPPQCRDPARAVCAFAQSSSSATAPNFAPGWGDHARWILAAGSVFVCRNHHLFLSPGPLFPRWVARAAYCCQQYVQWTARECCASIVLQSTRNNHGPSLPCS
jgi:hypothetical protein